ncbi:tautomerase family protein [Thiolinea disciformis]|uniref:tautomerase family protein n=1 Tax=Thiolinea disciformis TaxID=125614 RepID=UPI0003682569|nr:tautomerase family protein [Thiolinea disciformis]
MPIISFEAGQLSEAVKADLIEKLTNTAVEVTGISKQLFFVAIREYPDNSIAVGGKTVAQLKQEVAAKP